MSDHDKTIPHEEAVRDVVDDQVAETAADTVHDALVAESSQGVIADATGAAGANPTQAEYAALVAKFNSVLGVLRDAGLIPSA